MNKYDLCTRVAAAAGLSRDRAKLAVESVLSSVVDALEKGDDVHLHGFGTFRVVTRAKKRAFDMNNGRAIEIPERKVPHFKPSDQFKEIVSES